MIKYSLGLDISVKNFDACLSVIDVSQKVSVKNTCKFSNTLKGFQDLVIWLEKNHKQKEIPLVILMEATGVYYENCALFLANLGFNVSVILPNKAKKYFQALGLKSKNDQVDAQALSRMGAEQSLTFWQPISEYYYQLRLLTRHYQSLQEMITVMRNQLYAHEFGMFQSEVVEKQSKKLIENVSQQLAEIKLKIAEHINSNPEVKAKVTKLATIKGVGILTIAVMLAETNGFENFNNSKQLASYAGLDIVENQSGNHTGKTRISKKGNSHIRRALFMPAFTVVRHKVTPFKNLYDRTFERHFIKLKSYVAVQRKLLVLIYSLWKNDEAYDENRYIIQALDLAS